MLPSEMLKEASFDDERSSKSMLLLLADISATPVKMGAYLLGKLLGRGAFGSVYLGKKMSTGMQTLAEHCGTVLNHVVK